MIVETLLLDLMFDVPSDPSIQEVIIDEGAITRGEPPTVRRG